MKINKRRLSKISLLCSMVLLLTGCICKIQTDGEKKSVTYTEVKREKIPKELKEVIEESKKSPFHIAYTDQGKTYIAEGYGTKPKTGYHIALKELYEIEDTIYIKTDLQGPEKGTKVKEIDTYPYLVIEIKEVGKRIIFE